nr:auxin response factor 4-like [Tanacetum cinerariifolium]
MGNLHSYSDILASGSNAMSTISTFDIFYHPRSSQADFIVPQAKYMKSVSSMICVGARFKMKVCMDESPERRFIGVLSGVGDMSPYKWSNSKWRCLMVRAAACRSFCPPCSLGISYDNLMIELKPCLPRENERSTANDLGYLAQGLDNLWQIIDCEWS